jgi:MFS family permease
VTLDTAPPPASPFALAPFRAFWTAKLCSTLAQLMMVVVIGWQVYDIARQTMGIRDAALLLGLVGLAQFLPVVLLTLPVGWVADRFDRRQIARAAIALEIACAAALAWLSLDARPSLPALFALAALLGVARAFAAPALTALAPNLVPPALLPRAIAWNSMGWQVGAVAGPPLGGYLYAGAPAWPYIAALALLGVALAALLAIPPVARPPRSSEPPLAQVRAGLAYVRANRIVLGAISLDLFAVILGGATALLPIYARDILMVGPEGLGHLRAAPSVGAALVAFLLARGSLGRRVGAKLLAAVAIFGGAIAVFGFSQTFWLSLGALAVAGAADMVSVYVRQSLIQIHTPDAMRGRVAAVSSLFIGASNELGELQSGLAAALVGPVAAAVAGGLGAVGVALAWSRLFPALRDADRLEDAARRMPDGATPAPGLEARPKETHA